MNHWTFVWAAYALTAVSTVVVVAQSWISMRRAEQRVAELDKTS